MNTDKINWQNAIISGILGTIAFDIVGYFFTGSFWDIPSLLGQKTELGFAFGLAGHYANGILLAILYAGIAPSLWGPNWFRSLTFVTGETIALVWFFMFPLLGMGVAGLKAGNMMSIISLVRHFAYAIPLYYFIHEFRKSSN